MADAGKQKLEILVNLGLGAYCGTWVAVAGTLFYGDCGWQTLYEIALGLFHTAQELTRV